MNSIFLLNLADQTKEIKEAHFNLWMVGDKRVLDIGLRMQTGQVLELYLPWENAGVVDLYDTIKSPEVLDAIFNQHLTITNHPSGYTEVTRGDSDRFDLQKIKNLSQAKIQFPLPSTAGAKTFTKITIEPSTSTTNDSYIRLRVNGFGENVFSKKHIGADSFLNPNRESIEVVDFRVNEIRTVSPSDFQKGVFETPKIVKLHYFLLKSFRVTNSLSSPNYERCRELEAEAWEKYLPQHNRKLVKKNTESTLAYHWKKTINIGDHFSALSTFSEKKASLRTIAFYFVIIVLINLASNYFYDLIKSNKGQQEAPSISTKQATDEGSKRPPQDPIKDKIAGRK